MFYKLDRVARSLSRPVRARGLKHIDWVRFTVPTRVAPRAGAWIETSCTGTTTLKCWSRPVRARGLKLRRRFRLASAGASRPVRARGLKHGAGPCGSWRDSSRPVRARGLKPWGVRFLLHQPLVAPRAGAWIETGLIVTNS